MIGQLQDFRDKLDSIMLKCMHSRIAIYGYDTYTGRFLAWYANYYHGIEIDWRISDDMSTGHGYEQEVFRPSVFDFGYKDIRDSIIWLAQPMSDNLNEWLAHQKNNYGIKYFDFYEAVYGSEYIVKEIPGVDPWNRQKTGKRDIQFLEWLEYKYGCNFVTPIAKEDFEVVDTHGSRYSCSTQKEIFPMLDRCHMNIGDNDAIFDFGCGKGGAMVSFLDYGFGKVGGVEYETKTYHVAKKNIENIGIANAELFCDDARNIDYALDKYNWFYFFYPFDRNIFEVVINNMVNSYKRVKRKLYIIFFTAMDYSFIENTGFFRLVNQFTVDSRQRVVGIFESDSK